MPKSEIFPEPVGFYRTLIVTLYKFESNRYMLFNEMNGFVKTLKFLILYSRVTPEVSEILDLIKLQVQKYRDANYENSNRWLGSSYRKIVFMCDFFSQIDGSKTISRDVFEKQDLQSIAAKTFKNTKMTTTDMVNLKKTSLKKMNDVHRRLTFHNELMFI